MQEWTKNLVWGIAPKFSEDFKKDESNGESQTHAPKS